MLQDDAHTAAMRLKIFTIIKNADQELTMPYLDAIGTPHEAVTQQIDVRIVSLVPSITELLCALGLAHLLVGRTGFCIRPLDALRDVAKVGGTKDVNLDKLRQLAPTHVIVNIDENEKPTVERIAQFAPHIIVTHPLAVRDNLALYRLLGAIFRADDRAEQLCTAFEKQYAVLQQRAASRRPQRVVYCIWQDPWMCAAGGTYIANMLAEINWQAWAPPAFGGQTAARYPTFQWSAEMLEEVDLVLLSSEPFRFTEKHVNSLGQQIGKPVLLVDGEMFSWYGNRAILGLTYLLHLGDIVS